MSAPTNTPARRAALLEAARVVDEMADAALREARYVDSGAYHRVALGEAASQLVAARDRLRAMAGEAAEDPHARLIAAARWVAARLDDKRQPHLKGRLLDALAAVEASS